MGESELNSNSARILIIEDEPTVRVGLEDNLKYEGYHVFSSDNGKDGLEVFRNEQPDLVILDVMMPGIDGLEVCRQIRAEKEATPVMMLTAKGTELDKVLGLEMGADDYLTKPFGMRELFARVKALLRRVEVYGNNSVEEISESVEVLSFSDVEIDFRSYRAEKGGEIVLLSAKEFELMRFLANQPDVPVTRNELLDNVWGYNNYPSTRTVDNFIVRLRQKFEEFPNEPQHILTVHGVGYKFVF